VSRGVFMFNGRGYVSLRQTGIFLSDLIYCVAFVGKCLDRTDWNSGARDHRLALRNAFFSFDLADKILVAATHAIYGFPHVASHYLKGNFEYTLPCDDFFLCASHRVVERNPFI